MGKCNKITKMRCKNIVEKRKERNTKKDEKRKGNYAGKCVRS